MIHPITTHLFYYLFYYFYISIILLFLYFYNFKKNIIPKSMPHATSTHTHTNAKIVCVCLSKIFLPIYIIFLYILNILKNRYVVNDETLLRKTVLCRFNSVYSDTLGPKVSVRALFNCRSSVFQPLAAASNPIFIASPSRRD